MKYLAILSLILFYHSPVAAQLGCNDPLALNYNATATSNDGSCVYASTEYSPLELTLLPETLREASGVEWLSAGLFIHNDAGNPDRLYRIDSLTGAILQTITIAGADNVDWEDITEHELHLYLGDFGNNIGNRTDLRIYKIQKSELSNDSVNAEVIEFTYADQTDFTPGMNDHDFDCEAMIAKGDSLHLFTKNWEDNQTRHYVVPNDPGEHVAQYVESFDVEGLITGADIAEDGSLVLLGYTEFGLNFMWLLFDYQGHLFFSGNKRRIALGSGFDNGQTEGITLRDGGYGYICSEQFSINGEVILTQRLLSFSVEQWLNPVSTDVFNLPSSPRIKIYPNPCDSFAEVEISLKIDRWRLIDEAGRVMKTGGAQEVNHMRFSTKYWKRGIYIFEIWSEGKAEVARIFKK